MLDPVSFEGHIADDVPPAPERRIRGKTSRASVARGESRQIESGAEGDDLLGEDLRERVLGQGEFVWKARMNSRAWSQTQC